MAGGIGYLDQQGNACLKFYLCGVKHTPPGIEIQGVIDTGFTGFVQLPIQFAFSLGLPLEGTVSSTLADGSISNGLAALGHASFGGEKAVGLVSLEFHANEVLIGMDFLRLFGLSLLIIEPLVLLMPRANPEMDELVKTIQETITKEQAAADAATDSREEPNDTEPPS